MSRLEPGDERYLESRSFAYRLLVRAEFAFGMVLLVGLLTLVVLQVVSRYVFSSPFSWSEEAARFTFIWLVFVAAAFVTARRRNITVQLYGGGKTGKVVAIIEALAAVIVIVVSIAMAFGSFGLMATTMGLTSPGTGIPLPVVYVSSVVGFGLLAFHSLCNLWLAVRYPSQFAGTIDAEKGGV